MPECSCRGTNPNCFKCGGWGWLDDDIVQQRVNPDHLPLSPGKPLPKKLHSQRKKVLKTSRPQKNKKIKVKASKLLKRKIVPCPSCKAGVRKDKLDKHLNKVHGQIKIAGLVSCKIIKENLPKANLNKISNNKKRNNSNEKEINKVVQSCFETKFGDKFLGYFARDNGKFGSIPLYDDYSDESDSD